MELGLCTFGETATVAGAAQRLRELVVEAEFADRLGLDVFALGEHHRPDYAVSAPAVVLAAVAARTERIRLSSAVTVLSSDDPVRVFQDFATIDGISGGRAEIMAGRGSFVESFPLFGQDLDDYDELFATKLDLLLRVRSGERVTWEGSRDRAPIPGLGVYPRPVQDPLPVWVAVGGSPPSVIRAGSLGLPLALAIIGGRPERFVGLVDLYRRSGGATVGINAHTYVAETSERAAEEFWPGYRDTMTRIGRERGWPPLTRDQYEAGRGPAGHLLVGDPEQVAAKIVRIRELFAPDRFLAQYTVGPLPHAQVLRSIELLATEVRERVASRTPVPA